MALVSTSFRTLVSQALSVTNSSRSRSSGSFQRQWIPLTAPAQCNSFSGRHVPDGIGAPLRFSPKFGHSAQFASTTTKRIVAGSAEEPASKAVPAYYSSESESPMGQVSVPPKPMGGMIASLVNCGGQLGSSGNAGVGGGGREENVGVLKELQLLGCALVAPGVGTASFDGLWWSQYAPTMHDLLACVITTAGALIYLQIFNELAKRDVLDKKLSRKLVHIGVGLVFMLFWPLFTMSPLAPYLAAFAPGINGVNMLVIGSGLMNNEAVVKSMTRGGDRRELLKGPFYYAVTVVVTTVCFWRSSPVGIVALANLCAGDGFADIIGRNFGTTKLPYNNDKSIAGSLGFFIMSSLVSMLCLSYFSAFGFLNIVPGTLIGVIFVSFVTAIIESLPISTRIDDNFTVPFAAVVLGMLFLPTS